MNPCLMPAVVTWLFIRDCAHLATKMVLEACLAINVGVNVGINDAHMKPI